LPPDVVFHLVVTSMTSPEYPSILITLTVFAEGRGHAVSGDLGSDLAAGVLAGGSVPANGNEIVGH
jgi:hypothetical protein